MRKNKMDCKLQTRNIFQSILDILVASLVLNFTSVIRKKLLASLSLSGTASTVSRVPSFGKSTLSKVTTTSLNSRPTVGAEEQQASVSGHTELTYM